MKEQEVDKLIQDALKEDMKLPEGLSERLEKHIDRITSEKTPKIGWKSNVHPKVQSC